MVQLRIVLLATTPINWQLVDSGTVYYDKIFCGRRCKWVDEPDVFPVLIHRLGIWSTWAWLSKVSNVDFNSGCRKPARYKMIVGPLLDSMKGKLLVGSVRATPSGPYGTN
jgi:hypothetical protein